MKRYRVKLSADGRELKTLVSRAGHKQTHGALLLSDEGGRGHER